MKKRLFNIHKLIGINIILFFFISLFFGILTIFQPQIRIWEDPIKHFSKVEIEDINLDKCVKQITRRTYFDENGKKLRNDVVKLTLAAKELNSSNLLRVNNRPNFYLDPNTCKRVYPKSFSISKFFDSIHRGAIFNSLIWKIVFGFMSVAVVFLSLSGIFLIIKNKYRNSQTKTIKGFFAKYHRLLFLYTLPLIFMFGLTGALFNLGLYSSPLLTNYLTGGETSNPLNTQKNILQDPPLKNIELSKKAKNINLNKLYIKAKNQFDDIFIYAMEVYNYKDINARVKFIGYEPRNFFISSMTNETYIVLNANNAEIIDKKMAKEGSFAEKTLDSIFYLHYLRTFQDLPRFIFGIVCLIILFGLVCAIHLWLERVKKDKFVYKVLKPSIYTIILGSLLSSSALFASNWIIPQEYLQFEFMKKSYDFQEVLFYLSFILVFIFIKFKNDLYKVTKNIFLFCSFLLATAVISHDLVSKYNIFNSLENGLYDIFYVDLALIVTSICFFIVSIKLPQKYYDFEK